MNHFSSSHCFHDLLDRLIAASLSPVSRDLLNNWVDNCWSSDGRIRTEDHQSIGRLSWMLFRYLYHQLLSVITLTQLTRIFEQKKGYDLRRMIAGSERLLDRSGTLIWHSCRLWSDRTLAAESSSQESLAGYFEIL